MAPGPPPPPNVRPPNGAIPPPPPPPGHTGPKPAGPPGSNGPPVFLRPKLQANSKRIQDITPQKFITEDLARKELTSYAAYTLQKCPSPDPREKPTWQRVECIKEALSEKEITACIKQLDLARKSVANRKAALFPNQRGQITQLLDNLTTSENDPNFEWTIKQFDKTEVKNKAGRKETATITLFVQRSPLKDVNPIALYHAKQQEINRPPPPPQQQQQQQQQQQPKGPQQGKNEIFAVQNNKEKPNGNNKKADDKTKIDQKKSGPGGKGRKEVKRGKGKKYDFSDSGSDSDSDVSRYTGSDTGSGSSFSTLPSSVASRYRRERPRRHHERQYYVAPKESPVLEPRRSSYVGHSPYTTDFSRAIPITVDPVAEAFTAGLQAANNGAAVTADKLAAVPRAAISYPRIEDRYSLEEHLRRDELLCRDEDWRREDEMRRAEERHAIERETDIRRQEDLRRSEERRRREAEAYMRRDEHDSYAPRNTYPRREEYDDYIPRNIYQRRDDYDEYVPRNISPRRDDYDEYPRGFGGRRRIY